MGDLEDVIRTFDALYIAASERRDPAAVVDLFVDDEDISFAGSDLPERATTKDGILQIARGIAESSSSLAFEWQEKNARVEGDVAWVNAVGTVAISGQADRKILPYRVTAVLLRRDGRWLWHTHAGSEPR